MKKKTLIISMCFTSLVGAAIVPAVITSCSENKNNTNKDEVDNVVGDNTNNKLVLNDTVLMSIHDNLKNSIKSLSDESKIAEVQKELLTVIKTALDRIDKSISQKLKSITISILANPNPVGNVKSAKVSLDWLEQIKLGTGSNLIFNEFSANGDVLECTQPFTTQILSNPNLAKKLDNSVLEQLNTVLNKNINTSINDAMQLENKKKSIINELNNVLTTAKTPLTVSALNFSTASVNENSYKLVNVELILSDFVSIDSNTWFKQGTSAKSLALINPILTNIVSLQNNLADYKPDIMDSALVEYVPSAQNDPNFKPFDPVSSDPNAPVYNNLFAKINDKVIKSDLVSYVNALILNVIKENVIANPNFKSENIVTNIKTLTVTPNPSNQNNYSIDLDFSVLNESDTPISITLTNNLNSTINSKAVTRFHISGTTDIKKTFFSQVGHASTLLAGYSFNNLNLQINDQTQALANFTTANYSYAMNTEVLNVNTKQSYLDIKDEAQNKLKSTLTLDNIKSDINTTVQKHLDLIKNCIDPAQNILISISDNTPVATFLTSNAANFTALTNQLVGWFAPQYSFVSNFIEPIFKQVPVLDIINNPQFKTALNQLIDVLPIPQDFKETIMGFIPQEPITQEQAQSLIDTVLPLLNSVIKDPALLTQIQDLIKGLLTQDWMTFLTNSLPAIWGIVVQFVPVVKPYETIVQQLTEIIKTAGPNAGILDVLVQLMQAQDSTTNVNLLTELLKLALPNNAALIDTLNNYIFSNKNITPASLATFLKIWVNPTVTKADGTTSNKIIDFYNAMTIGETTYSADANYDSQTSKLNLVANKKFTFGATMDFTNIINGVKGILPTNIPAFVTSLLFNDLKFATGDYYEIGFNFKDSLVQFAINKDNSLNWQAKVDTTHDINMPNTVKSVFDGASTQLANWVAPLFFQKFHTAQIFSPLSSAALSSTVYENYDAYKLNGNAISLNTITPEQKTQLLNLIDQNTTKQNIGSFVLGKNWIGRQITVNKIERTTNFDLNTQVQGATDPNDTYLNQLFNLSNYYVANELPVIVNINNQMITDTFNVILTSIPAFMNEKITLNTYFNVYDNGIMTNSWTVALK